MYLSSRFVFYQILRLNYFKFLPLDLLDGNIKLDQLVLMFELAMESSDIEVKRSALNVICRVCRHVGFSFCRIATRIIRLIQETKDIPEKWRWKTYYQLNEVLGIGSMLYTRFSDFVGVLARNLHDVRHNYLFCIKS